MLFQTKTPKKGVKITPKKITSNIARHFLDNRPYIISVRTCFPSFNTQAAPIMKLIPVSNVDNSQLQSVGDLKTYLRTTSIDSTAMISRTKKLNSLAEYSLRLSINFKIFLIFRTINFSHPFLSCVQGYFTAALYTIFLIYVIFSMDIQAVVRVLSLLPTKLT